MKKIFKKRKTKHYIIGITSLFLFIGIFLLANPASAGVLGSLGNFVTALIGWIFAALIYMMGILLMLLVRVLVYIASIQSFINVAGVTIGWSMVRDLANMFFIIILLIIAFATILRIEKYNYKKWLPKLILMAILINYSKMICGILIDFAQVIMLSFVNSFRTIGGTNITNMLGIRDWQKFRGGGTMGDNIDISNWEIIAAYFLVAIYVIISIVVIGTMILVLVMRIVMIWIYVVLSPFAFLLSSFPGGQGYASKWWTQFTQNLVVGPVLAFFIWLSFSIVTADTTGTQVIEGAPSFDGGTDEMMSDDFGRGDLMIQFIVSIGLLIGGLKVSQEIGGAAGSMAGKGMARLNKMSLAAQKGAIGAGKSTAKFAGRWGLQGASWTAQKVGKKTGWEGLEKIGDIGQKWRADIKKSRKKDKVEKRKKFLRNIGMGEGAGDAISSRLKEKGLDKRFETMYEATDKMGKDPKRTRTWKEHLENPSNIQEFNGSDIWTLGSGLNKRNTKAMLNSPDMLKNFENWLKGDADYAKNGKLNALAYTGDAKDLTKAKAIKTAIEEAEKEKIDGFENANSLKTQLDNMNLDQAMPTQTTQVNEITTPGKDGIKYNRKLNDGPNYDLADNVNSSNINKGKLFTNSFASGNKEIMGVGFNNLKEDGVDIDVRADGANLNKERMGDNLKPIVESLINQINQAKINIDSEIKILDEWKESGEINEDEYNKEKDNYEKEKENLDKTKTRLNNGEFKNINLVNTNSPKYGREMSLRNAYHEELHGAGLKDEYVTKAIENSLMDNKLYGRNPETGGRHASEIGQIAAKLEKEGKSDKEIVQTVGQEIKNRSRNESSSRAERVIKLEKGELETESQAVASYKKEKKGESMIDVARERGLVKKQMDFYRKMTADGLKKDERGKYDENKVKIGEDGLKKMEELSKSLDKLDSLKQEQSSNSGKMKDYQGFIELAKKHGAKSIETDNRNNLRKAEKEQVKISQEINTVSNEINNKKESIEKDVNLKVDEKKKSSKGDVDRVISEKKTEVDYNVKNDYDTAKLESIINDFSSKLEKDLSDLDKGGKKNPLVIKQAGESVKFDQANFFRSINNAIKGGNVGVIKSVNAYNKASNEISKKVILNELRDQLDN